MEGWKLKEGKLKKEVVTEENLWAIFNNVFSTKSVKRTTYKLFFLKSIIECYIDSEENHITYDVIFLKFTEYYWDIFGNFGLINCDKGVRGRKTKAEKIFEEYIREYNNLSELNFHQIPDKLKNEIVHKVKNECKKYVVGALYGDTNGYLYEFSNTSEYINLSDEAAKFIKKNNSIILGLIKSELIKFYNNLLYNII